MNDFWQEDNDEAKSTTTSENVVDVLFRLRGSVIRVDHAWLLAEEIGRLLPWFARSELSALHTIHVAETGNGWQRPDAAEALLHLSRRTRLGLRLAKECLNDVQQLVGETLNLPDGAIEIGDSTIRPLVGSKVQFARYVVFSATGTENDFLEAAWKALQGHGIKTRKMLCGREQLFNTPQGPVTTRSLMLADLDLEDSIKLQELGLGEYRTMGCGIFMPHKGIDAVGDRQK